MPNDNPAPDLTEAERHARRLAAELDAAAVDLATNGPVSPAELRGFFAITQAWRLSADDARVLLGAPTERTVNAWRAGKAVRVPIDTMRRIGYIAGIFQALGRLYADPRMADDWINRPNRAFGGQTPLQRMRAGDVTDLAAVRLYLDAAQAPWS